MTNEHDATKTDKTDDTAAEASGERIAKVMARAGLCSRRDAEAWIAAGRVSLNGKKLLSPAVNVQPYDDVRVDGKPLPEAEKTRLFRYHKPRGLVTTAKDPEGRPTVFENLPERLPRVISVGRLDLNSEGLLLLTNDGELARRLELPATGWVRRYRVRVNGRIDPASLTRLASGIEIEGVRYGAIEAALDRQQGDNAWLTMSLTEGKNREIRKVCAFFGWSVSRLIRLSYGPFQLGHLEKGEIEEVPGKVLRDQLGQPGTAQPLRPHQAQGGKARPPKQVEGKPRAKHIRPDRVYDERADADQNPRPYDRKRTRVWKYVDRADAAKPTDGKPMPEKSTHEKFTQEKPARARPEREKPVREKPARESPGRDRPQRDGDRKPQQSARPDRTEDRRRDDRRPERPHKHAAASEATTRKPRDWAGKDGAAKAKESRDVARGGAKVFAAKPREDRPRRDDDRPQRVTLRQDRNQDRRQDERKPERPQRPKAGAETASRKPRDWAGKDAATGNRRLAGGKPDDKGHRSDDRAKAKGADVKSRGPRSDGAKPSRDKRPTDQRSKTGPAKHAHRQRRP